MGTATDQPRNATTSWIITHSSVFSSSSKRTFIAVATPVVWILPHNLHLSQPTQSMILVTFLKWSLNSCFKTYP